MFIHTNIPLPLLLSQEEEKQKELVQRKHAPHQHEARTREERLRQADVPRMTDFFHVSRLPNKQRV